MSDFSDSIALIWANWETDVSFFQAQPNVLKVTVPSEPNKISS